MVGSARRARLGLAIRVGAIALLATACAHRDAADGDAAAGRTAGAAPPAAQGRPAARTLTPARFDAYVLALRNIRAAHPTFVAVGANPAEVREEMRAAVQAAGLTLEEFEELHRQVQADPMLKAEVERRLGAAGSSQPTGSTATSGAGEPVAAPSPAGGPPAAGAGR